MADTNIAMPTFDRGTLFDLNSFDRIGLTIDLQGDA